MKFGGRIAWLSLGILLIAVVFSPSPGGTRWIRTLHNAAHGPIFGCVALAVMAIIRAHPRSRSLAPAPQYLISFTVAALLGALTEVTQAFVGRDASFSDALHDVLGAATFLALFSVVDPRLRGTPSQARVAAFSAAMALLAILAVPIVRSAVEYRRRDDRFPVLADFSRELDRYFIGYNRVSLEHQPLPARWAARADEAALRVIFLGTPYPGISIREPRGDWSAYTTLALDITNPTGEELRLSLRIDDAHHNQQFDDRFNASYCLPAGERTVVRIPLSEVRAGPVRRVLDMKNVAAIFLFRANASRAGEMYLSRAWLE